MQMIKIRAENSSYFYGEIKAIGCCIIDEMRVMKQVIDIDNKCILVTGGAGFIGANLIIRLLKECNGATIVNIDPVALEKAFEIYPDVKLVVIAHLYGTPGKIDEIKAICDRHGALIVEDAAESLGATYKGIQTGTFGDFNAISFNGNNVFKTEVDVSFCNKVLNNTHLAA